MSYELSIAQMAGRLVAAAFLVLMVFNGLTMLISPAIWMRLPNYVAFNDLVRYNPQLGRSRQLQIRFVGLVLAGVACTMLMYVLGAVEPRQLPPSNWPATKIARGPLYTGWCLATCLAVAVYGVWGTLRPQRWFDKYYRRPEFDVHPGSERVVVWAIRILSFVLLLISVYFAWGCVRSCGP